MNEQQISLFQSKQSDNWSTPKWLYDQLNEEFHFDMDPCPLGSETDGLAIDWNGSIFVNPPYSKVEQFLIKAHEELRGGACSHNSISRFCKYRYKMVSQICLWSSRTEVYKGTDKIYRFRKETRGHASVDAGDIQRPL